VARHAGATVYAVLLTDPLSPATLAPVVRRLGLAGADKVLVGEASGFGAPALDATHGPALHAIAERLSPIVVLFPAGGPGPELGAPLAMRLGGAFGGCSDLVLSDAAAALPDGNGRLTLRRWRGGWSGCRDLDPVEIERPVVAILGGTGVGAAVDDFGDFGEEDVELEIVSCPPPQQTAVTEVGSEPDELAALELARTLVVVDGSAGTAAARALAAAASPALAVVDGTRLRPAALAHAAPAAALFVGKQPLFAFGSPSMRVGLVGAADAAVHNVDVVWAGPSTNKAAAWGELARALASLDDQGSTTP
jgi:hypothetical protein